MSTEFRRGCGMLWKWSDKQLWVTWLGCFKLKTGPLQVQYMLLAAEPFLRPYFMVSYFCFFHWDLLLMIQRKLIDHSQHKLEAIVNVMVGWINFEKYYDRLKYWTKTNKNIGFKYHPAWRRQETPGLRDILRNEV